MVFQPSILNLEEDKSNSCLLATLEQAGYNETYSLALKSFRSPKGAFRKPFLKLSMKLLKMNIFICLNRHA